MSVDVERGVIFIIRLPRFGSLSVKNVVGRNIDHLSVDIFTSFGEILCTIDIDGANAAILLKADVKDVDDLGERVSSAEISINGLESEIALKADTILLDGYVKASDLETDVLEVVNASYIETLSAGFIGCGDVDAEQVNCTGVATDTVETDTLWAEGAHIGALSLGGTLVSSASESVVVSMNGLSKEYTEIWYMDSDGTEQYARVLTNVELRYPNTATINYLTTDASGGT